jgi:hypothetical protein
MKAIVISVLIFISFWSFGQSTPGNYTRFTPERRAVLAQMGEFFDRTVCENFPSEHDTLSYKHFFRCILTDEGIPFVVHVNRDRLKEINHVLFKNENYWFFYARHLIIPVKQHSEMQQHHDCLDSVPAVRYYTMDSRRRTEIIYGGLFFPRNPNGYFRSLTEKEGDNPLVRDMVRDMELAGDFSITLFMNNVMHRNLREISNPIVKELMAVVFWNHLCFCGGVDLVNRKGFCETCNSQQDETPEVSPCGSAPPP